MPTKIEWTQETWNPVTGCAKVSEGCRNCYAERMARRLAGRYGYPEQPHHFDVTLHLDKLKQPLRWKKPRTVFVCSMSDLFHKDIPLDYVADVFRIMALCRRHTFQVLTKRAERMRETMEALLAWDWAETTWLGASFSVSLPLQNVWLGVSVENQVTANERIPLLLRTPAAVRFVSVEPMLEAVDLNIGYHTGSGVIHNMDSLRGYGGWGDFNRSKYKLDWVICGGESGPGARPMNPQWARDIRDQCQVAGVPYFYKQHGAWLHESQFLEPVTIHTPNIVTFEEWNYRAHRWPDDSQSYRVGKKAAGRLLDGRQWNEMPK